MANGRMDREQRAKQFMPFAALKGFDEVLRERERIVVPRAELSEDRREELDRTLRQIGRQDMVTVVYFSEGAYLKITGMVSRCDVTARVLTVVNTRIPMEDIYDIQLELKDAAEHGRDVW